MNRWECTHPDCIVGVAIGVGCAAGLRAIGWHFETPWRMFCPAHHPRGIEAAREQAAQLRVPVHYRDSERPSFAVCGVPIGVDWAPGTEARERISCPVCKVLIQCATAR